MTNRGIIAALAAAATCVSVASADSVFLDYTGVEGGIGVQLGGAGPNYSAGHMKHTIYSSTDYMSPVLGSFNTFCIELENASTGEISEYQIVNLTDAPEPDDDGNYTTAQADAVIDAVTKAVQLGWIDNSLQTLNGTSEQITAIQAAIWEALGFGTASSSTGVMQGLSDLSTESLNSTTRNMMAGRLRAAVASGEQDMLYVVPLPPAAFAGLGLMGCLVGVRAIRRR